MPHTENDAILLARLARRFQQPKIAQQCLDGHPDSDSFYYHFEKSLIFLATQQIERAEKSYMLAQKRNPTHPWIQACTQGKSLWIEHLQSRLDRYL